MDSPAISETSSLTHFFLFRDMDGVDTEKRMVKAKH